jgi:hypothetical protein
MNGGQEVIASSFLGSFQHIGIQYQHCTVLSFARELILRCKRVYSNYATSKGLRD